MSHFFPTEVWSYARKPRSVFRYFSYQRIGAFTAISDFTLIVATSIATGVVYHFLAFDEWGDIDAYVVIGCYSGLTFVLLSKLLGPTSRMPCCRPGGKFAASSLPGAQRSCS